MPAPNQHTDSEKTQLLNLLIEIRKLRKDIGGYIEHYYHNENTIVIKLTNGILKIKEYLLDQITQKNTEVVDREAKKLAEGFVPLAFS